MKQATCITTSVFLLCFFYAILRYNIYGNVDWEQIPLYTTNKAIAFTAIFNICLSSIWRRLPVKDALVSKYIGLQGFSLVFLHVLISLVLLHPQYYQNLFDENKLTFLGNIAIFCGIVSFLVYTITTLYSLSSLENKMGKIRCCVLLGMLLTAGHVSALGIKGWFTPYKWYGNLIPISLGSIVVILMALLIKLFVKKN